MIVVTVELWPGGNQARAQSLGTAHIVNDVSSESPKTGNYDVRLFTWSKPPRVWKRGRVTNFDRINRGPWDLLFQALKGIIEHRNANGLSASVPLRLPDRDTLGRTVREIWLAWAREQENPKLSWLVPYDELSEEDKEVDRRIGEKLFAEGWCEGADATSAYLRCAESETAHVVGGAIETP